MKFVSVTLTQNTELSTNTQRWQACKAVARDYPAIGYLHTHQTAARGGKFSPHIHLFLMLPEERVALWTAGAKADLVRRFAPAVFELSDRDNWVIGPDSPVNLLRYAIGQDRTHTPVPAYWTSSNRYRDEQQALDALLSQALFRPCQARGSFFVTPKGNHYMPDSKRRSLSPTEHETASRALSDLSQRPLNPSQLSLYRSLESYFSWDGKLSNKQLDALERLQRTATRGAYGTAESDSDHLNAKLNVIFNPMKNGGKN